MKRYYAAAGALLLGTSALAWAADKISDEAIKPMTEAKTGMTWDKSMLATTDSTWDKSLVATSSDTDSKFAFADLSKDLDKLAATETAPMDESKLAAWSDGKVETAFNDTKLDTAWSDSGKIETADSGKIETATVDKVETGMGGPLEEIADSGSPTVVQPSNANPERDARGIPVISDVAFVPPGFNGTTGAVGGPDEGSSESYPACTAQRTDNCIQLYERGVHSAAATTESTAAMGGPYEPVDSADLAMNGDGQIDAAKGETSDGDVDTASVATDTAVDSHSDYQGVGGPIEAQSGYPPCSPGPGDDRCIQLYERGVTGSGN